MPVMWKVESKRNLRHLVGNQLTVDFHSTKIRRSLIYGCIVAIKWNEKNVRHFYMALDMTSFSYCQHLKMCDDRFQVFFKSASWFVVYSKLSCI